MVTWKLLWWCILGTSIDYVLCTREKKIQDILDTVHRIEDQISKEDRFREIADIVRIDSTVDKINIKMDRMLNLLDNNPLPPMARSDGAVMPRDLGSNILAIQNRLESLETTCGKMQDNLGAYSVKVNEIEQRTTQLKDDMNVKLRKMMNVLTALYEMNKEMKKDVETRTDEPETPKSGSSSTGGYATEFLMENFDELERKIREQFSILTSEIRSEVTSLKVVAASSGAGNCQSSSSDDEEDEEWMTPQNNARSIGRRGSQAGRSAGMLDNLMETLGRSTREIREEIQQGIQGIDDKLENLTSLAQSQPKCGDLETAESAISRRRSLEPFGVTPQQQRLEENKRENRDKCSKTAQNVPNPKSCADLRKGGATCDGIYVIFPKGRRAVRVYCDMTTDNGGWTLLLRRGDYGEKMTSFHRNWMSYKNGFGDSAGEFWLGNDVMNSMTTEEQNVLRIHLTSFDHDEVDLVYDSFVVGNESTNYKLVLGRTILGPAVAANSLRYHNNQPFSTYDRKNEDFQQNCAATYKGGWWFNGCYFGFLTGEYFKPGDKRENWQGMLWYDWKGNAALKAAEMMIRPKNFTLT
uniref:Techylectin-5B n=1 Tax=Parasteatoda tepidariorum TaxID=114398 RepID=A0A2L2XYN9_PARTP